MVGVDIVRRQKHRRTLEQAAAGRSALTVDAVDARYAQDADPAARSAPQKTYRPLCVHPAPCAWRVGTGRSGFRHNCATTVPVHTTRRSVHQRIRLGAAAQGRHQAARAGVGPPLARGRGQVQHPCGQAGQPAQRRRVIEIGQQGPDPQGTQFCQPIGAGRDRRQADSRRNPPCHTKTDISTTDQQYTLAAEAGRQGTEGGLV